MPDRPRKIVDIKPPKPQSRARDVFFSSLPPRDSRGIPVSPADAPERRRGGEEEFPRAPRALRFALLAAILATVGLAAFYIASAANFKKLAEGSAIFIYREFEEARDRLTSFEPRRAAESFGAIKEEIEKLREKADQVGLFKIADVAGSVVPKIKNAGRVLAAVGELTRSAQTVSEDLDAIKRNAFPWMMRDEGALLIGRLQNIEKNLSRASDLLLTVKNEGGAFAGPIGDEYLPITAGISKGRHFLGALLEWLDTSYTRHFLVFFQNPSEMRPGGGFIGSYADLTLKQGNITGIDVRDIYDPDGQLEAKTVPPKPLQAITKNWGARDANWFFDFPASARKVIGFLERSKLYREKLTTFDGAMGVNVRVIETLLDVLGPTELPEYELALTSENFLEAIQREVETGRHKALGEPKKILKDLTPLLFERLAALTEAEQAELLARFKEHLARKDIMLYFKDPALQTYLESLGATGSMLALSKEFRGEYLAVVSANIAGGKTDAYLKETISLKSTVDVSGEINNELEIERVHRGNAATDPWYTAINKSYLKIFTPRGSKLSELSGATARAVASPLNYEAAGYAVDEDIRAVEETRQALPEWNAEKMEEAGKTVFAAWVHTKAGESKKLVLRYANPAKINFGGRAEYQMIFERQSGADTDFALTLEAPPGYVWEETRQSIFTKRLENGELPARFVIDLRLVPSDDL